MLDPTEASTKQCRDYFYGPSHKAITQEAKEIILNTLGSHFFHRSQVPDEVEHSATPIGRPAITGSALKH